MEGLCELVRLNDMERLYDVRQALAARGVDADRPERGQRASAR
jgi:hypothetical protein